MKKLICIVLAAVALLAVNSLPAEARGGHGGGHVGIGLSIGPAWWGPGWWGPYPYYPYYPYYPSPPVVVQQPATDFYVQPAPRAEEPRYWYFCPDPQGYYPAVKKCPKGWLKVVPPAEPPEGEE